MIAQADNPGAWVNTEEEQHWDEMMEGQERHAAEAAGMSLEEYRQAEAKHHEEMEQEEREAAAAGGLRICPSCGNRTLRVRSFPTRQYGGGYNTTETCEQEGCGYTEVYV